MNAIIIYYSKSGITQRLALQVQKELDCDILKVEPEKEYGNYSSAVARVAIEKIKKQPMESVTPVKDLSDYDTVIIGYPIWYSNAPQFFLNYLKKLDFSSKCVIPFSTSGSGNIGIVNDINASVENLKKYIGNAEVRFPFNSNPMNKGDFKSWVKNIKSLENYA